MKKARLVAIVVIFSLISAAFQHSSSALALSNPARDQGILVSSTYSTDFDSSNFQQSMRNAAADGVNYVTLVVSVSQANIYASSVYPAGNTPTDQALASGIQYIHSLGMRVMVSLHDDPADGNWRAYINPSDRTAWFASYGQYLNHYADIAQANGAETLSIGTEMSSLTIPSFSSQNTPGWIGLIQSVRQHYSGLLTYGAQYGQYYADDQSLGFWSYLDEIGISAYFYMGDQNTSAAQMEQYWAGDDANELSVIARTYNKPLIFTEIGYVSGTNGVTNPGSAYSNPGSLDLQLQATAYQAVLAYWQNSGYMKGLFFWDWSTDPNAGGVNNVDYTPQGKPAEQVMKQWFTAGGSSPAPTPTAPATYSLTAGSNSPAVTTGNSTTDTVTVSSSQAVSNDIVDVEVYNSSGTQVAQKYYQNQNLSSSPAGYQISWTPNQDGQYTVKAGIFTANWQSNVTWNGSISTVTASAAVATPPVTPPVTTPPVTTPPVTTPPVTTPPVTTPPANASVDIWWPSNGAGVSGVQPFKATIDGANPASYTMYWQVDGGQLNAMYDSANGGAHKEAMVDLSGWNWHGNGGQYVINFVAKDTNGNVIAQKSTTITIYH